MRTVDDAVGKHTENVLLDDVRLAIFDAFELYSGYFRDPDGHLWEINWNPPT